MECSVNLTFVQTRHQEINILGSKIVFILILDCVWDDFRTCFTIQRKIDFSNANESIDYIFRYTYICSTNLVQNNTLDVVQVLIEENRVLKTQVVEMQIVQDCLMGTVVFNENIF